MAKKEREMGKIREDVGFDSSRWRGKRGNRFPLMMMLLVFFVLAGVTTFISIQTPVGFNPSYSDEEMFESENAFGTRKAVQRAQVENNVDPYTPVRPDGKSSSGWSIDWQTMLPGVIKKETFFCERSHIRTDICRLHGNVHLVGNSSFVLNKLNKDTPGEEESIRPYTRKWEKSCMDRVGEVRLKSERPDTQGNLSTSCDLWHRVPAVVFSTGGYTGNVYHEFNDGLIPLYITSQHLKGEVIFVIVQYQSWWMTKYEEIIRHLSKYEVIDIANQTKSHCFLDVTTGLFIHDELAVDDFLMPNHESIQDFRALLSQAYPLEESGWEAEFKTFSSMLPAESIDLRVVPQLMIIVREGNRVIVNLDQVVELAARLGFNVTLLKPDPTTEMKKIFWVLDRCDVLIGVHGAALTHFLFLRPGSVFIQVVPLGTDWAARTYYGIPAKKLGLHYFEYKITVEESSLSNNYGKNDPVLTNPNAVIEQGWSVIKEIYLTKQNVKLSMARFAITLEEAKRKWKASPPKEKRLKRKTTLKRDSRGRRP